MDLDQYINDNLDEILANTDEYIGTTNTQEKKPIKKHITWKEDLEETSNIVDERNEDEATNDELQGELLEEYYNKKAEKEYLKSIGEDYSDSDEENDKEEEEKQEEISEHKLNLLNLFLIHYNEKYERCENYFTNITDIEKDTTTPMEFFFESMVEFKKVKQVLEEEDDEICMDYYFEDMDDSNIEKMFNKFPEGQMYCLDYLKTRIISPSLLVCLNYLSNNKKELFEEKNWNIFHLRDN
jgi:hypothetical protein